MKNKIIELISKNEKKIFFFILFVFFVHLFFRIFTYKDNYFSRFDPDYWENRYYESQWVVVDSKNPIGDDGLFSYAGWKYIHGESPNSIVPEYPPLGKYLLGLSILIFKNQNVFALIIGLFVLLVFYLLNKELFSNKIIAFTPVFLLSLESLFYQQLKAPYFDLLYLLFLMLTFFFFLRKKYFLSYLFLGCFASVKFPSLVIIILACSYLFLLIRRDFLSIKKNFFYVPLIFLVYILTYFRYFWLGNSFIDFLGLQKWIVNYYLIGAKGEIFSVFPILLTGNWNTWWSGVQRVGEWSILWPIIVTGSLIYTAKIVYKKDFSRQCFLLSIWILCILLFLSVIPVFPRYLLLVIPFMYNLTVCTLLKSTSLRSQS